MYTYEGFINWPYSKKCSFGERDNRVESNYSSEFLREVWVKTECPTGFVSGTCLRVVRNTFNTDVQPSFYNINISM